MDISFVVCAYNDFDEFVKTVSSLLGEIKEKDQVVVIDSSNDNLVLNYSKANLEPYLNYLWVEPAGVYAAQNSGIRLAKNEWIQIVNSGDCLTNEGLKKARKSVSENSSTKIHVFQQEAFLQDFRTVYSPEDSSIWPHQSIICHKDVYNNQGFYDETFSLISDQLFFFDARKVFSFRIYNFVLTLYPLDGISTHFGMKYMVEKYTLLRVNNNIVRSFFMAFPLSCFIAFLNTIFGAKYVYKIKFAIRNIF
jgi:hypothetical protein